jgi:hypothetical protein
MAGPKIPIIRAITECRRSAITKDKTNGARRDITGRGAFSSARGAAGGWPLNIDAVDHVLSSGAAMSRGKSVLSNPEATVDRG